LFRAITSGRRLERQTVCEAKRLSRNMRPSRAPSREQTRAVPEGILWSGKRIGALALADIDHLAGSQSSNFRTTPGGPPFVVERGAPSCDRGTGAPGRWKVRLRASQRLRWLAVGAHPVRGVVEPTAGTRR